MRVPKGNALSRKEIDDYTKFVGIYGAKGLAYVKVNELAKGRDGLQSPILKFLPDTAVEGIIERTGAQDGDLIFFGADKATIVNEALGALRVKLGHDLELMSDTWQPLWVVDFPMFEWDDGEDRWQALHHPFTAPQAEHIAMLDHAPGETLSRAYDMVINGTEVGGGSIRIHRQEVQQKVFHLLGIEEQEAQEKFGFLLTALKYGCPPHGGLAFGLDRLIMLTHAPSDVAQGQLRELHLRVRKPQTDQAAGGEG